MRSSLHFATFLLVCAAGPVAAQTAMSLTAAEAVREALRTHPLVRAAEARLAASEARYRGTRAWLNPEATIQHGFGRDTGGLDEDIVVAQVIELAAKRVGRIGAALEQRRRAQAELTAAKVEVAFQARQDYLAVQEAAALRDQARANLALAERARATAEQQFQVGEVPRTQVLRAEIEVGSRQQALDEAEAELLSRTTTLNSALGRDLGMALAAADPLPEPVTAEPLSVWRSRAEDRPELLAARAELRARQAGLRTARTESLPNFVLTGVHADLRDLPGNSVRIGLVIPLWDFGAQRAKKAEARAAIAEQQAQVAEAVRQMELDVQVGYDQAVSAEARVRRYRSGQLDRARRLAELAQAAYEVGHSSLVELLDAQRALQETEAGYLKARADAARARLALERATGSLELLAGDAAQKLLMERKP
jgi:cobalt-zinc-cadmium efflux system outer membrane protein